MQRLRELGLALLSAAVMLYSTAVLYHVWRSYDLGIQCLMSDDQQPTDPPGPTIGRVDPDVQSRLDPLAEQPGPVPQEDDRLVSVGGQPTPTFMHFHQRLRALNLAWLNQADNVDRPGVVGSDRECWVQVVFVRDQPGGGQTELTTWLKFKPVQPWSLVASIAWFGLGVVILTIGALVVSRRPGDPSALLYFGLCAVSVVTFLGIFHRSQLGVSLPLVAPLVFCGLALPPMMLHFLLLFPRPLGIIRRWPRGALLAVYGLPAVWMIGMGRGLLEAHRLLVQDAVPQAILSQLALLNVWIYSYFVVAVVALVVGHWVLVYSFLNSRTAAERNQVTWILGALVLSTIPAAYLLHKAVSDRADFAYGPTTKWTVYLTSMLFTITYAAGITRYKLMHVGRLATRGIMYMAISLAASLLFCLLVGIATGLVGRYYFSLENAVAAGLTAMVVVIALGWVRDRVQRAVDRRFRRERFHLDRALQRLGRAVDRLVEPVQLARRLLQSAKEAVLADSGAVYLRDEHRRFKLAVRDPALTVPEVLAEDNPLSVEMCRGGLLSVRGTVAPPALQRLRQAGGALGLALEQDGETIGLILLGPKLDHDPYSEEDCNFLRALARTATLALKSAQGHHLIEQLRNELEHKVQTIARQQQQIHFLQGELLARQPAETAPQRDTAADDTPALRESIRGRSESVQRMLDQASKVAGSGASVLIRGESGTGKGLLAQAIHAASPRRSGPFVTVHCAALSPSLLESELFGHVKGAFTGADRDKVGRFELADGGTLFLDEIGDVSLEIQTKLLRVLQEKAFERVGEVVTRRVDVRLIAATHQNLEDLIRRGKFREDLYYRLNVISVHCPPLRERREDIVELALHFLQQNAAQAGKRIVRFEDDCLEALLQYDWPGNIRQLENAIERAVVLAEGQSLRRSDLPPEILHPSRHMAVGFSAEVSRAVRLRRPADRAPNGNGDSPEDERARLAEVLHECGGNKSLAARRLGLPRSTLFSKLRRLGME